MHRFSVSTEIQRLAAVQRRVRELATKHVLFADAIRGAFEGYLELATIFHDGERRLAARKRELARGLLERGVIADLPPEGNPPCFFVEIEGLCPVPLAKKLAGYGRTNPPRDELGKASAAAALAALKRGEKYRSNRTSKAVRARMDAEWSAAIDAKTHVVYTWTVLIRRPDDWTHPPNPGCLEPDNLARFCDVDFHTISLHRLGGLADSGAARPIVPQPKSSKNPYEGAIRLAAWEGRLVSMTDRKSEADWIGTLMRMGVFSADLAEQMLAHVEGWVQAREHDDKDQSTLSTPMHPMLGAVDSETVTPTSVAANANKAQRTDEVAGPALTKRDRSVLQVMASFDRSMLASNAEIAEELLGTSRLSEETVRRSVNKLIAVNLAERPEGNRSGARLTTAGFRLAGKIAD